MRCSANYRHLTFNWADSFMKRTNIWKSGRIVAGMMAVVGGSSVAPAATPQVNDPSDIKAIRAVEDDLAARLGLPGIVKHYAPHAAIIDISSPNVFIGRAEIAKDFGEQVAKIQSMKPELLDEDILSDGTLACSALQVHLTMVMKDGKVKDISFRQIDGLRKVKGTWLIEQEHLSVPADAKSQMAVMNGPLRARGAMDWGANPLPGPMISAAQGKADIRKWVEDVTTVMDPNALMTFYGPQDGIQVYDIFYPGTLRGQKEIRDVYAPMLSTFKGATITMPYFTVDSDGLLAIQLDKQDVVITMKDGSTQNLSLRQSDCLRHVDGKWYAFFDMISFPVDPATGKAVMAKPFAASIRSP
jgi:ketosteroid isomerase-like protein